MILLRVEFPVRDAETVARGGSGGKVSAEEISEASLKRKKNQGLRIRFFLILASSGSPLAAWGQD